MEDNKQNDGSHTEKIDATTTNKPVVKKAAGIRKSTTRKPRLKAEAKATNGSAEVTTDIEASTSEAAGSNVLDKVEDQANEKAPKPSKKSQKTLKKSGEKIKEKEKKADKKKKEKTKKDKAKKKLKKKKAEKKKNSKKKSKKK